MMKTAINTDSDVIDIKVLVGAMKAVKSSVMSEQKFLPILSSYCFYKGQVFGHDDIFSFTSPYGSNILDNLALPSFILGILKTVKGNNLRITRGVGNTLRMEALRFKLDVPFLDRSSFIFIPPTISQTSKRNRFKSFSLTLNEDFIKGLSMCLKNVIFDVVVPNTQGVSLRFGQGSVSRMYSTDNITVSRYMLKERSDGVKLEEGKGNILLPKLFCTELVSYCSSKKDTDIGVLYFFNNQIWVKFSSGVSLHTKIQTETSDIDFEGEVFSPYKKSSDIEYYKSVRKLELALDRALLVLGSIDKNTRKDVRLFIDKKGSLVITTDLDSKNRVLGNINLGTFLERIPLSSTKFGIDCIIDAQVLKRACQFLTEFGFWEEKGFLVFRGGSTFVHIINSLQK